MKYKNIQIWKCKNVKNNICLYRIILFVLNIYILVIRRKPMYEVTFSTNGGGNVSSQSVEEGSFVTAPTETIAKIGYNFTGWNYDFSEPITKKLIINAKYELINYTITFKNYDGSVISEKIDYHYGDNVEVPSEVPTKPNDNIYQYIFEGWHDEILSVNEDKVYTAIYLREYITYTIIYHNTKTAINNNKKGFFLVFDS